MSTTLLRKAAVDSEFRAAVLANPEAFGADVDALPAPVATADQEALDLLAEGIAAIEIYACKATCSFGPITMMCDGTTK